MRYLAITSPDINNGNKFRVTWWMAGCRHHCPFCQNKHTWDYNQGKDIREGIEEIKNILSKPYIGGLTLSGGDPLDQETEGLKELKEILKEIRAEYPEKDVWIYTGYCFEDLSDDAKDVLKECDILVDGPFKNEEKDSSLAFRGSRNQRIINLRKTFEEGKVVEVNF